MRSTVTECVVAMYPSPAGATESELHFEAWDRMVRLNPVLRDLEPDIEGLIVNRLSEPPAYAIAPIDRCYALTGAIKARWEGISGGSGVELAVAEFFAGLRVATRLRRRAVTASDVGQNGGGAAPGSARARVCGARACVRCATPRRPSLTLDLQVTEPTGRAGVHDRADASR